jgi:hypothetical protein
MPNGLELREVPGAKKFCTGGCDSGSEFKNGEFGSRAPCA